jgi:hypothetical protein
LGGLDLNSRLGELLVQGEAWSFLTLNAHPTAAEEVYPENAAPWRTVISGYRRRQRAYTKEQALLAPQCTRNACS